MARRHRSSAVLLPHSAEMAEGRISQIVAWPIRRLPSRSFSDCRMAVVGLAATGRPRVERLHLAEVRIRRRNCRGLTFTSILASRRCFVGNCCTR